MSIRNFIFFSFLSLLLLSCRSKSFNIAYLEDIDTPLEEIEAEAANYDPKFKIGDCLIISVSAIDPVSVAPFNLPAVRIADPSMTNSLTSSVGGYKTVNPSQTLLAYVVESDGTINFPVLGRISVLDKDKRTLTKEMEERISKYVDHPIVNISFNNFKVSVIGEVLHPGSFSVSSDRISLFDALGLAGDLTIYGNRKNVKLIRDKNGKKEVACLDLTDSSVLKSPYFYLEQNDVVYVEPNDKKKKTSRYSQTEQFKLSVASTIISVVSVIGSVLVTIFAVKN